MAAVGAAGPLPELDVTQAAHAMVCTVREVVDGLGAGNGPPLQLHGALAQSFLCQALGAALRAGQLAVQVVWSPDPQDHCEVISERNCQACFWCQESASTLPAAERLVDKLLGWSRHACRYLRQVDRHWLPEGFTVLSEAQAVAVAALVGEIAAGMGVMLSWELLVDGSDHAAMLDHVSILLPEAPPLQAASPERVAARLRAILGMR